MVVKKFSLPIISNLFFLLQGLNTRKLIEKTRIFSEEASLSLYECGKKQSG